MRLNLQFLPQILGGLRGKCLFLQSRYINLKLVCLCLYRVCVVDENCLTIGPGGYVIPVATVSALRVSPVINALSVLGGT